MTLLTYEVLQLARESPLASDGQSSTGGNLPALPMAYSPGTSSADIALLFIPPCHDGYRPQISRIIAQSKLTVYPLPAKPDRSQWCAACRKTKAILAVCDASSASRNLPVEIVWRLGWAAGAGIRVAVLPIFAGTPRSDRFAPRGELARFFYAGIARGVGESVESLWVIPPGELSTSRDAVNLEFWIGRSAPFRR